MLLIAMVSQKGGVGKSTLARLIAREYAAAGYATKIVDLDISQGTSYHWQRRRLEADLQPQVPVECFGSLEQALRHNSHFDVLIADAPPHSNAATLRLAERCAFAVLPTGLSLDDLQPAVLLAHEFAKKGIPKKRLAFALCRVGDSELEIDQARQYIADAGYETLAGAIPEKTAYRRASDEGRTVNETRYASLNARSDELAQSLVDHCPVPK